MIHCHLHTHFLFSSVSAIVVEVQHPFSSSFLSRFASHLCKSGSAVSLALHFGYRSIYTHFEACELQNLLLVRSLSLCSAYLHFVQDVVKPCIPSMHHRAMHIHDTLTFLLLQGNLQLGLLTLYASEFLLEFHLCPLLLFQLRLC